jgi:dTMP kinase
LDKFLRKRIEISDKHVHLLFTTERKAVMQQYHHETSITIILDRYVYSGYAYSVARGKLTLEWCLEQEKGLPEPDLIFHVKRDPNKASARKGFGEERFDDKDFQIEVSKVYDKIFQNNPNVHVLNTDAEQMDQVTKEMCDLYDEKFKNVTLTSYQYY